MTCSCDCHSYRQDLDALELELTELKARMDRVDETSLDTQQHVLAHFQYTQDMLDRYKSDFNSMKASMDKKD